MMRLFQLPAGRFRICFKRGRLEGFLIVRHVSGELCLNLYCRGVRSQCTQHLLSAARKASFQVSSAVTTIPSMHGEITFFQAITAMSHPRCATALLWLFGRLGVSFPLSLEELESQAAARLAINLDVPLRPMK